MIADIIKLKLELEFQPSLLKIEDQSDLHKGHLGAKDLKETHFKVLIVSDLFAGVSQIERHKMVYRTLAQEMAQKVHALSLKTYTIDEYENNA